MPPRTPFTGYNAQISLPGNPPPIELDPMTDTPNSGECLAPGGLYSSRLIITLSPTSPLPSYPLYWAAAASSERRVSNTAGADGAKLDVFHTVLCQALPGATDCTADRRVTKAGWDPFLHSTQSNSCLLLMPPNQLYTPTSKLYAAIPRRIPYK